MKKYLLAAVAFATACGGGSVSIGDFDSEFIKAECKYLVRCEQSPDQATCEKTLALNSSSFLTALDAVDMKKISYDGGQARDCLDIIADQNCDFDGFHTKEDACDGYFEGKVAMGGACFYSIECVGGAACTPTDPNCDTDTTCCPGTCGAAPVVVASGGSCGDNDTCADGTYCKPGATSGSNGTCTPYITADGAPCDAFEACANPMICDIFADAPTCETPAPKDGTCDPNDLLGCIDQRQHCDDATMKCVNGLPVGSACMYSSECISDAHCVTMKCTADSGVGGMCADGGVRCLGDLSCTNGTCQLPTAGMSCL